PSKLDDVTTRFRRRTPLRSIIDRSCPLSQFSAAIRWHFRGGKFEAMAATELRAEMTSASSMPAQFNVATYFVDRNVEHGRGDNIAIEYGDLRISYRQVLDSVNRFGNALKNALQVRNEERIMLVLLDCPEYAYSFFGAIKIGAVPIPTST